MPTTHTRSDQGRLLFTIVGGAALVVAAFLNWTRNMTGVTLSNHSLIDTSFLTQTDVVRTVGGIAVVIGLVGMFGLVDHSGWLTRLCGVLGIALFVMFLIEVLRSSVHTLQVGSWLGLAGGIVMLIGGFMPGPGTYTTYDAGEPTVVEERRMDTADPRIGPDGPRGRDADYDTVDPEAETELRGGRRLPDA